MKALLSTKLAILGTLLSNSMSGNEIKKVLDEEATEWSNIEAKEIYFGLSELSKEGFISSADSSDNSKHSRVFTITPQGKLEFTNLLHDIWATHSRTTYDIDVGVHFLKSISVEEAENYIRNRISELESSIIYLQKKSIVSKIKTKDEIIRAALSEHKIIHIKAEISWLWDLFDLLKEHNESN